MPWSSIIIIIVIIVIIIIIRSTAVLRSLHARRRGPPSRHVALNGARGGLPCCGALRSRSTRYEEQGKKFPVIRTTESVLTMPHAGISDGAARVRTPSYC